MEFLRSQGYPAPEVIEVSDDGIDLVMERISGPTMLEMASAQPWKLRGFGQALAELHVALHNLRAPDSMPAAPVGKGDRVLHLDLHPLNIIMSERGPVVIDWTNACRGNPMVDVAATWVLLASGTVSGGRIESVKAKIGRGILVRRFLRTFLRVELDTILTEVVEWKTRDVNMTSAEIERMRALL